MSSNHQIDYSKRAINSLNENLSSKGLENVDNNTFCVLPFSHLSTTTDGEIRLCCRSAPLGHIKDGSLSSFWSGEKMKQIRKDLIAGEKVQECRACWKIERKGMFSLRRGQNIRRLSSTYEAVESFISSGKVPSPTNLELKLSNMCNLRCRMCSPIASTQWFRSWETAREFYTENERAPIDATYQYQKAAREPVLNFFLDNDKFLSDLEQFKPSITDLEFAGGEPLIDPLHYEVLNIFLDKASDVSLKYSTNLTTLGTRRFNVMEFWPKFKKVYLTVSIDGFPSLNEYIRVGTNTAEVEKHIQIAREMPNVEFKASTCISALNAPYLTETFDYILKLGIPIYFNRATYPAFMDARVLPLEVRKISAEKLRSHDWNSLKTRYSKHQWISIERVLSDCAAWLEDDSLENAGDLYETYLRYTDSLDQLYNTSYQQAARP